MELAEVFGAVLREHRIRAELTQEQFAFEADIRRNYVSMLELGQHQPTLTMLFSLAAALKCSPSDLIAEVEQKLKNSRRSLRKAPKPAKKRVKASPRKSGREATDSSPRRARG
ncbi:helix-turn-helix domain-containing protein [Paraburkholderia youngii]|uniref:Transcriptional regulator with XRE-family HTH domain n=1 Tax=Paraburkholderia youngii TaxID=2782701 RepID=A0A7W8P792_9BURK|nr:helix-turn-helix transcriptional regulator [Paraburkholderia youngii]MBB5402632.1 transcriptional regulator with XRE-family HTH domain [Paraburkholderia youngii]